MSNAGKTVAKNAIVLMGSQLVTWTLTITLMVFLPRYLGPEGVGQIHLSSSLWAIMAVAIQFGMDLFITKEVARDHERAAGLFGASVVVRMVFFAIGFFAMAHYTLIADYPPMTVRIIYVIGLTQIFEQIASTGRATLQGLERMGYISIATIISRIFNTIVSITLLLLGYRVLVIALVIVGTALVDAIVLYVSIVFIQGVRPYFDIDEALRMLRASVSYLMNAIVRVLYIQVDIVVISLLVNETVVGWYGVADQLFGTMLFIPSVFVTAVYPTLARLYKTSGDGFVQLIHRSFNMLLLLSLPIGFGVLILADSLVVLLFGADFIQSGPILAVMGIVMILTYQNMLVGQFLVATDRQNKLTLLVTLATLATIPLDLILIPWCNRVFGNGAIGGALAFVVTEGVMLFFGIRSLPAGSLQRSNIATVLRALLAAGGMAGATWLVRDAFILVPVAVGAVTYIVLVLLLRLVPQEELTMAQGFGHRLLNNMRGRKSAVA